MNGLSAILAMTVGWKILAPVPDPVGFGGMFAGVIDGKVVAGGGSQFRTKPLWLNGEKSFSDAIYILDDPAHPWRRSEFSLPRRCGHFAVATDTDAIYLAGGIDPSGCLKQTLRIRANGDGLAFDVLPDLPEPVGYAAGAVSNGRLYVVGGLPFPTSKTPSAHLWSLNISKSAPAGEGWRREADFPGQGLFVSGAAAANGCFWVVGGVVFDHDGKAVPSKAVYAFDPATGKWQRKADLPSARVAPSSPCPVVDGRILAIGGYSTVFTGAQRDHPGFDAQTFAYSPEKDSWDHGPVLPVTPVPNRDEPGDPGPSPMIGAPCVIWKGLILSVGGEVRSSVRTNAVVAWPAELPFKP